MNAVWRNCQRCKRNRGEYVTTEICPGSRDEQNDNAETQLTDRAFKREKLWQNEWGKSKNWKQFKKGDSCDHRRQGTVICTRNTLVSLILEEWENSRLENSEEQSTNYVCGAKNPSNTFKGKKKLQPYTFSPNFYITEIKC